jgi:segregation and condensation protein B
VSDERPDSLAAQAASWVPPWERQQPPPDRDYQVAAEAAATAEGSDSAERPDSVELDSVEGSDSAERPDDDEDRSSAGLSDDDDDFDESFEGANPPGHGEDVPAELPPLEGERGASTSVDAPVEVPEEDRPEPTDLGSAPEVPVPVAIEDATEEALESERGPAVDDTPDAGNVFDAAADDDVSDDGDVDLPFAEDVPSAEDDDEPAAGGDEPAAGGDEPAAGGDEPAAGGDEPAASDDEAAASDDEAVAGDDEAVVGGEAVAGDDEAVVGGEAVADDGAVAADDGGAAVAFAAGVADADAALSGGAGGTKRAMPRSAVPPQGRGSQGGAAAVGGSGARTEKDALAHTDRAAGDEGEDNGPPALFEAPESRVPALDDAELRAALEAILLVVDEPVAELQLAQIMEQPTERVAAMLEDISARYTAAGHGFDLRRVAGGWRLYTRPEFAAYVERFVLDGQSVRLTQAALETLAVVAYKQPVTRSRISAIRGVNCDGVMRTLTTRGLIEECGTEGETGAYLYRTTPLFLEKLGLNSVDQLPPLAPFLPDDVDDVLDSAG